MFATFTGLKCEKPIIGLTWENAHELSHSSDLKLSPIDSKFFIYIFFYQFLTDFIEEAK